MIAALPQTSPTPPAPKKTPNLANESDRAAYTPAAVEAYLRLAEFWRLTAKQAAVLLGEESERAWFQLKAGASAAALTQDSMTRVSALVGVYKGLHLLFSDPLADEWVRLENRDQPFEGVTPLDFMIAGGVPTMLQTRNYIDALRGGL